MQRYFRNQLLRRLEDLPEMGEKFPHMARGNVRTEFLAEEFLPIHPESLLSRKVQFYNVAVYVERKIRKRGKVKERLIAIKCVLERNVCLLQFAVLHLQFHLMDVQLFRQRGKI